MRDEFLLNNLPLVARKIRKDTRRASTDDDKNDLVHSTLLRIPRRPLQLPFRPLMSAQGQECLTFSSLTSTSSSLEVVGVPSSSSSSSPTLTVQVLRPNIVRVTFRPDGQYRDAHTYGVTLGLPDPSSVPPQGVPRSSIVPDASTLASLQKDVPPASAREELSTSALRVVVSHEAPYEHVRLHFFNARTGRRVASDAETAAYSYARSPGGAVRHRMCMTRRMGGPACQSGASPSDDGKTRRSESYYGGGDSPGRIDRYGQHLRVKNVDAMGYDCGPTAAGAPAYKQWPVSTTVVVDEDPPAEGGGEREKELNCYTVFYDTCSRGTLDFGSEVSAFRGFHRTANFECGDLEYYFILGEDPAACSRHLSDLIGRAAMPPKYAVLGYTASSMTYADSPDISSSIRRFRDKAAESDIPVDAMYLSSGYTCRDPVGENGDMKGVGKGGERCVFNWCKSRVPSPEGLFEETKGVPLICNTKPWLLECHPMYDDLREKGGYVVIANASADEPAIEQMWSGGPNTSLPGSFIDFTSNAGYGFWVDAAKNQLVDKGCRAIWVDNNEYELEDGGALCGEKGDRKIVAYRRPAMAVLMAQASLDALKMKHGSIQRPLVVTRAGAPGSQRSAALTWSGDNFTSWETLRWNTPMASSLGVAGFPAVAHDVGGFAGPRPSEELFVRWCQSAALTTRFTIHSWNDDGTTTEPWSYGTATTERVKKILSTRTSFGPYLYSLFAGACWDGALNVGLQQDIARCLGGCGAPITRPLAYEFPLDPFVRTDNVLTKTLKTEDNEMLRALNDHHPGLALENTLSHLDDVASCDYMLGSAILVCPIYVEGATSRACYLPAGTSWLDLTGGGFKRGGGIVVRENKLDSPSPIVFLRGGHAIALSGDEDGILHVTMAIDREQPSRVMRTSMGDVVAEGVAFFDDDEPDINLGVWYHFGCLASEKGTLGGAELFFCKANVLRKEAVTMKKARFTVHEKEGDDGLIRVVDVDVIQ